MCGPAGATACGVISLFGAVFMGIIAILINKNYKYLGEWVDTSSDPHAGFDAQQKSAVKNCWIVAGVYLAMAVISAVGSCYYAARAKRS